MQVSYTFCCDFLSLLMKSAGSSDEFGPTEVVVQGLKKVSRGIVNPLMHRVAKMIT